MTWPNYLPQANATDPDGNDRQFGLEIEFSDVELKDAVEVLSNHFSRAPVRESDYVWHVDTDLGKFRIERDIAWLKEIAKREEQGEELPLADELRRAIAPAAELFMPLELVAPALRYTDLPVVDRLVAALASAGARGTSERSYYAFGTHVNAGTWSLDTETLTRVAQSFAMLQDFLIEALAIDLTRRLTTYIDPYPREYLEKIIAPDYKPELEQLIKDYVELNPTRNRGLDFLVLFAWLDETLVRSLLPNEEINTRPAFHFRLPNSLVGIRGWKPSDELRSWAYVEQLACDEVLFDQAVADTRRRLEARSFFNSKRTPTADWFNQLRANVATG